jgi:uncharacterized protein
VINVPEENSREDAPAAHGWRESKWLALVEFLIVGLIFVADTKHLIPLSKTPFLLFLGWISLRLRRVSWRSIGLTRNRSWMRTLAFGAGTGILIEAFQLFISQPMLVRLTGKQPDLSDFRDLPGNFRLALIGFALVWTLGAFGEELVWRGYLMNRVADLGRRTKWAWMCSLVVVNIVFGFAHGYQGVTGVIDEGLMGVLLGVLYLWTGFNLGVPIIAHGTQDTIDLLLIFFRKYPGM